MLSGMSIRRLFLAFSLLTALSAGIFISYSAKQKRLAFCQEQRFIPFDASMNKRDLSFVPKILAKKLRKDTRWQKIEKLYAKHILHGTPSESYRIPKIIHQIWLGGPLPARYKEIQKTWAEKHPDWEYRLWTDADAKVFPMKNRALFETATNWGEKADIFRYEILSQFGGLYVDTDFECLRPFDILHKLCDFYIGLDTIEKQFQSPRLLNGLLACSPHHPIIEKCLSTMSGDGARDNHDLIQYRTGPGLVTRTFLKSMDDQTYKNVAIPSSYFYPLPGPKRDGTIGGAIKAAWVQEESFAIHYWDGSWIEKK